MSEERKQVHEELGKLMRREGVEKGLSLVSAYVTGYKDGGEAAKTKSAADTKPETETEPKAG